MASGAVGPGIVSAEVGTVFFSDGPIGKLVNLHLDQSVSAAGSECADCPPIPVDLDPLKFTLNKADVIQAWASEKEILLVLNQSVWNEDDLSLNVAAGTFTNVDGVHNAAITNFRVNSFKDKIKLKNERFPDGVHIDNIVTYMISSIRENLVGNENFDRQDVNYLLSLTEGSIVDKHNLEYTLSSVNYLIEFMTDNPAKVSEFQSRIDAAQLIFDNASATQREVDTAIFNLEKATNAFLTDRTLKAPLSIVPKAGTAIADYIFSGEERDSMSHSAIPEATDPQFTVTLPNNTGDVLSDYKAEDEIYIAAGASGTYVEYDLTADDIALLNEANSPVEFNIDAREYYQYASDHTFTPYAYVQEGNNYSRRVLGTPITIDTNGPNVNATVADAVYQNINIPVISDEPGVIYLVPEGINPSKADILATFIEKKTTQADTSVTFNTGNLSVGQAYQFYAVDSSGNVSYEPSESFIIKDTSFYVVDLGYKGFGDPDPGHLNWRGSDESITIKFSDVLSEDVKANVEQALQSAVTGVNGSDLSFDWIDSSFELQIRNNNYDYTAIFPEDVEAVLSPDQPPVKILDVTPLFADSVTLLPLTHEEISELTIKFNEPLSTESLGKTSAKEIIASLIYYENSYDPGSAKAIKPISVEWDSSDPDHPLMKIHIQSTVMGGEYSGVGLILRSGAIINANEDSISGKEPIKFYSEGTF